MPRRPIVVSVVGSLAISLVVLHVDDSFARLYGPLAERAMAVAEKDGSELWFPAEGALRPAFEARGGRYLRSRVANLKAGSYVAVPSSCHHFMMSGSLAMRLKLVEVVVVYTEQTLLVKLVKHTVLVAEVQGLVQLLMQLVVPVKPE